MLKQLSGKRYRATARAVALAVVIPLLVCCDGGTTTPTGGGGPSAGAPIRFEYPYERGVWSYVGGDANEYRIDAAFMGREDWPVELPPQTYLLFTWHYIQKKERKPPRLSVTYLRFDPDRYVSLSFSEEIDVTVKFLVFPLEVGNSWLVYTSSYYHPGWKGVKANVVSKEKIAVPAGTFDCYKIEYTGSESLPDFTIWWASGVGGWGVKVRGYWSFDREPFESEPVTVELERYRFRR